MPRPTRRLLPRLAALALSGVLVTGLVTGQGALAQDQGQFGKVIRIERNAFAPDAGQITFSEFGLDVRNPAYEPGRYGAKSDGVRVTFGGYFAGQRLGTRGQCPRGASLTGCVVGTPISPLRLDPRAPATFIADDGANPRSPSLSGSPRFNGPVTILFDRDIAGIGLAGGFFDTERSTAIQAFDRRGNLIGGVKNISTGMEYMALVTEDGSDRIAGLQFSLVGAEPEGYAIDDLSFALAGQIRRDQVPGLADVLGIPAEPGPGENAEPTGSLSDLFDGGDEGAATPDGGGDDAPTGSLKDLFGD